VAGKQSFAFLSSLLYKCPNFRVKPTEQLGGVVVALLAHMLMVAGSNPGGGKTFS
jgi:hypothetical protein